MQDKYKPQAKYDAAHTFRIAIKFNTKTDADILAYMSTVDNKQGLIKALIRAQMAAEGIAAAIAPAQEDKAAAAAEAGLLPDWND